MRLAVKLATYNTPRGSSSARSAAWPPMATTRPKVPPHSCAPKPRKIAAFHQNALLTIRLLQDLTNLPNKIKRGRFGGQIRTSREERYSALLFLRRSTISPRNKTDNTAQTIRTIELSIVFPLLSL